MVKKMERDEEDKAVGFLSSSQITDDAVGSRYFLSY